MAPRKRTTKQQKNDPRALKLEAFLRDFDSEMETRVKQLEEKTAQMLKDVENSYNLALLKIPRAVRQMNWLQVFTSETPGSSAVDNTKREEEAAVLNSVMAEDYASLLKSVKKTSKKKGGAKSSSEEETVPSSTRKGRTTKRPPASSKRVKAPAASGQNTSLRRSNRRPLVTPARNPLESSVLMGATPLFTPRFDPRLPQSTVRVPRHKERVYSISVNGSPIAAGDEDVVINIPSGNGESLQLLASQINRVDLSQLDQTAVRSIRLLQNQLSTLCGISE